LVIEKAGRAGDVDTDSLQQLDTSFAVPGMARFRANVYRQRGTLAVALRAISFQIPALDSLGLPRAVQMLAELERGLVLVVGAAGNGKSTTLAAMVHHLNHTRRAHVITIEDPMEF